MGLLRSLLLSPIQSPINATLWVAGRILEAAESEHNDPARIRQALRELETSLLRGEISEETYDQAEEELLTRLRAIR